jgi:hypothetical protein
MKWWFAAMVNILRKCSHEGSQSSLVASYDVSVVVIAVYKIFHTTVAKLTAEKGC